MREGRERTEEERGRERGREQKRGPLLLPESWRHRGLCQVLRPTCPRWPPLCSLGLSPPPLPFLPPPSPLFLSSLLFFFFLRPEGWEIPFSSSGQSTIAEWHCPALPASAAGALLGLRGSSADSPYEAAVRGISFFLLLRDAKPIRVEGPLYP